MRTLYIPIVQLLQKPALSLKGEEKKELQLPDAVHRLSGGGLHANHWTSRLRSRRERWGLEGEE